MFIYLFLELKYNNLLSYNYFLFTFDRKCLKIIIAFSKRDGLKMDGSSIGLGKNDTVAICNYCSKDVSVANMEEVAFTSHMKDKKHIDGLLLTSILNH